MPDTGMLIRDEKRLNDFLDFARYTVPKQSVYGITRDTECSWKIAKRS